MATQPQPPTPPPASSFDTAFASSPFVYFYNEIDSGSASIHSHVLGPNISFSFHHPRALTTATGSIDDSLKRKTIGFLTLVAPKDRRVVLAWAESGHGLHKSGELLAKQRHLLSNRAWTRRVMHLSRILGMNMGHPYDKKGRVGAFRSCHVEVKLGAHAIYVLLTMFGIGRRAVSLESLGRLSSARWEDGSRPRFEIYFSKKNCRHCAGFIEKLQAVTGVEMRLLWAVRLEKIVYKPSSTAAPPNREGTPEVQPGTPVIVDLGDAKSASERTSQPVGHYIEGLAYCLGQIEHEPLEAARRAIVALARVYIRQNEGKKRKRTSEVTALKTVSVSKPLPATPETEAPWLLTPQTGDAKAPKRVTWDADDSAQRGLFH